jgi:hypothetical protein
MATAYTPRVHYTPEQLQQFVIDDLRIDAEQAEERAAKGGADAATWAAYGAKCRADITKLDAETKPRLDQYGWPVAIKEG